MESYYSSRDVLRSILQDQYRIVARNGNNESENRNRTMLVGRLNVSTLNVLLPEIEGKIKSIYAFPVKK